MKKYFISFLALIVCTLSFSQSFYVISQRDVPLTNKTFILNISNCDSLEVYTCPPTNNINQVPENQFTDITMNFTSIYYVSGWGSLYKRNIADTVSCQYLGNFPYCINALATSNSGAIYGAGQIGGICKLFKYDAGTFSLLGTFPPNFFSAGDLFFYQNRLFMTGTNSVMTSGYIVEVDVNNPSQSCYYMPLGHMKPWAAFSINNGVNSSVFITTVTDTLGMHTSKLYEVNMVEKTIGAPLCTYPYFINGAATVYSFNNPGNSFCNTTSLNAFNESGRFFKVINPVKNAINIETNIDPSQIQSLDVFNTSGDLVRSLDGKDHHGEIDVSDLAAGIYVIRLNAVKGERYQQKLIKLD